ncbi:hypothetical protein [Jatrophihabitans sp.]|uniref:hypothetical protein n=1 Tax=Jatrophihabitans sp. TaxID=1932789 RepID=UPI002CF61B3D|nr:hypothetical protein [Jatrophihabitans sp.]
MSEQLNAIPPARRRRLALALAPLGGVLLVAGMLAFSRHGVGWMLAGLLVGLLALVLLGIAWGLRRSAALTEAAAAEQRLDEVLMAAAGPCGVPAGASGAGGGSTGMSRAGGVPAGVSGGRCGSTGLACPAGSTAGGCGASCLAR